MDPSIDPCIPINLFDQFIVIWWTSNQFHTILSSIKNDFTIMDFTKIDQLNTRKIDFKKLISQTQEQVLGIEKIEFTKMII